MARADLSEIWDCYAGRAGRQRADKIVREISDALRPIEDHPFAGRARDEVRSGLRSITARPYVIFIGCGMTLPRSCEYCMGDVILTAS